MRILISILLLGCSSTGSPDTAACTSSEPCARVTGYSCEAGAETEAPFEGGLVYALSAVYVTEGADELAPWDDWMQDTSGLLRFTCPDESTPGSGLGNVLVYYYET